MDRNFLLAIALSFLVLSLWANMEARRREAMEPQGGIAAEQQQASPGQQTPPPPFDAPAGSPRELSSAPPAAARPETMPAARVEPAPPVVPESLTRIETALYRADLSTRGGSLVHWELTQYDDASAPGRPPVVITTPGALGGVALATPFDDLGYGDLSTLPYELESNANDIVIFVRDQSGIRIRKTWSFDRDAYTYRLRIDLENHSSTPVRSGFPLQWGTLKTDGPDFQDLGLVALVDGSIKRGRLAAMGKTGFLAMRGVPPEGTLLPPPVDWAGAEMRYFLAVVAPQVPRDSRARFVPILASTSGLVRLEQTPIDLAPGQQATREFRGYIGPKEEKLLTDFGAGLNRSINRGYAWITPLVTFFSWLLHLIHGVIPNYGVAIILLTIAVRLMTAPLMAKQMKSMKKMGELQPRMRELQEKFADDRQRQSQEMMKLYKETGVNPLGGCFPLLLQFPVFIGLYYALQSSIDLRQAPFFGWIHDLSVPETLFVIPGLEVPVRVLPIIMGATMIAQQKLTPTTMDPAQARMMMFVMPVMFTVLFYTFPSGLVLYWMVSNMLAIGHQLLVNRKKEAAA